MSNVVPMYGFGGGGGAAIGLKVVGGLARPANPAEGLVWAKTDVEPTGHHLSATAPGNPIPGMLWIKISDSSNVEIGTPLGKDYITIKLDSVSQYVNGAWVSVEAQSFQGGVWNEFAMYLYRNGNEYESLTGGWGSTDVGYTWGKNTTYLNNATKNSDSITIASANGKAGAVGTKNKIDVTNYSRLKFAYSSTANNEAKSIFALNAGRNCNKDSNSDIVAFTTYPSGDSKTVELDVSKITGSYYVIATADSNNSTTIFEVYGEG